MVDMEITQYGVYWVHLSPTVGSEISKTRPCVVVSPDDLNMYVNTVIIIPLTTKISNRRYRVRCHIDGTTGEMATDHIKSVDKRRVGEYIGKLSAVEIEQIKNVLLEMFQ
jgi:mRNA interferase MazF